MEPLKSHWRVLLFLMVFVLATSGNPWADAAEMWSTANIPTISHSAFPDLGGHYLVWQARGRTVGATSDSGDWEIFLFSIDSQVMIQVTDDDYDDFSARTDGDYVVWQKHDKTRGNQIYLYEIGEGNAPGGRMISHNDGLDHYTPEIARGRIVWTAQLIAESFEPGQIMLYDARNLSGPEVISDRNLDCSSPRIDGERVVWTQSNQNGATELFMYDLTERGLGPESVDPSFAWEDSPQRDGKLTVLTTHDGSDREVFLYDAGLKFYEQITHNDVEDRYPRISGNNIAWVSGEGEASEVYLSADLDMAPPEPHPAGGGGDGGGGSCFIGTAAYGTTGSGFTILLYSVLDMDSYHESSAPFSFCRK
jgi:hypothetical protein